MIILTSILMFWVCYLVLLITCGDWFIHLSQTKYFYEKRKWISYFQFKKMFSNINWKYDIDFPNSLFTKNFYLKTECHASIIAFDNIGYFIRTPIEYFFVNRLIKKYIKKHFK